MAFVCFPELEDKTLWLKILDTLDTGIREIELELTQWTPGVGGLKENGSQRE